MADILCGYTNRDEVIAVYVYDEVEPVERAVFEAHLAACAQCRQEIVELGGVRDQLANWRPPQPMPRLFGAVGRTAAAAVPARRWWRELPGWAQAAAALLFLGIGAGAANLEVRYDQQGLTVRTGWSRPAASTVTAPPADTARRADLAALEQRLRTDLQPAPAAAAASQPAAARPGADAELVRRVRALIDDSERRQQRELALRVAQVVRDVSSQRQADLVRIDRTLGQMQNTTGVEVMKQRELLNYVMRSVSLQR